MIRQVAKYFKTFLKFANKSQNTTKMSAALPSTSPELEKPVVIGEQVVDQDKCITGKRHHDEDESATANKKLKNERNVEGTTDRMNRKKIAMLLVYCGKGYLGMQRNPGARTIESDLMEALLKTGLASQEQIDNPSKKMHFQRAARTDKGVSAAGQICSLMMDINVPNPVEKINENLVDQIRVIAIQRVTKRFDSKNAASARTYQYLLPTYAFTPCEEFVLENYRIPDDVFEKVNETLALFKGTKNFHNFTSGKKANDPSARRYIMDFSMDTPFVRKGLEFAVISVKGQSFMLHQIRKMIGLTIAIVRGLTGTEAVEKAYGIYKCDVPKAPGLGLMLDKVHYDYYNKRFGDDGVHEPILWEKYETEINNFKENYIFPSIIDTEVEEKSMMKWLATLHLHHFDVCKNPGDYGTPLLDTHIMLKQLSREEKMNQELAAKNNECSPTSEGSHSKETTSHDEGIIKESNDESTCKTMADSCHSQISLESKATIDNEESTVSSSKAESDCLNQRNTPTDPEQSAS